MVVRSLPCFESMPFLQHFRRLTPKQRNTFIACFLGWSLDAFDFFILILCVNALATQFHERVSAISEAIFWTLAMRPVGAFLFGMMADRCYALQDAELSVMNLPAMSRVTKIPLQRLEELAQTSPVFAPGAGNYVAMGALDALWSGDLQAALAAALAAGDDLGHDGRRERGAARGGRLAALAVARQVRHGGLA